MVLLDGGRFLMGTEDEEGFPDDGERPMREVMAKPFYIDATTVTNRQFRRFVKETGYKTDAERLKNSFVFHNLLSKETLAKVKQVVAGAEWWKLVPGACWKNPEGKGSNIEDRQDHPVTHVSWNDAIAYCRWAGKRLPTEAEWEFAARGGLEQKRYAWGDEFMPNGEHYCNTWQGDFPRNNTADDGYLGTAPARSFPPNGYNLYNVAGNVWEWCWDWWDTAYHVDGPRDNPTGPPTGSAKVIRGGSFLCHKSYCNRYRVAARTQNTPDSTTSNMGFRCVADLPE